MDISLKNIYSLSEFHAHEIMCQVRWPENKGESICPKCGCLESYFMQHRMKFKCKGCDHHFSVTSGTNFSSRKLSYSEIIGFVFLFVAGEKGTSSCHLSRIANVQQKTAWLFSKKLRSIIASEVQSQKLDGIVEIDGATFGGHRRHANINHDYSGSFKRYTVKKVKDRRVITIMKQRGGRTVPFVGRKESDALECIKETVSHDAIIQADESRAWDSLLKLYEMMRIKHDYAFSANMACTNNAESFFSQMRKAQNGTFHKIGGDNLQEYACEVAWKRDHTELTQIEKTKKILELCLNKEIAA